MLEERVGRVVCAEGRAHGGNRDALRLAVVPDKGHDLFTQIRIDHRLDVAAMERVRVFVVKSKPVDGIQGEQFDAPTIDEIRKGTNHTLAFELPFVACAGRKSEQWRAPMAIDDNAKLHAEPVRIPAVILAFHPMPLACRRERKYASMNGFRAMRQRNW